MGNRGSVHSSIRLRLVAGIAAFAILSVAALAVIRATRKAHPAEVARALPTRCSARLLVDWSDGLIEERYPIRCYRHALKSLPEDLRIYSSAPDDIAQALSQQIAQTRTAHGHDDARTLMGRAASK
jgi:hypothetical protein